MLHLNRSWRALNMIQKWDILFAGHYTTSYSPLIEVKSNFGFTIRNEFEKEDFQSEPYLTLAKEKITRRLKKRGYTNIVITSIEAVAIREKKKRGGGINKLAKRFLGL